MSRILYYDKGKERIYLKYNESVHMRLSEEQKEAIMNISIAHKVTMSTTLRRMIEHCLSDHVALDAVIESVSKDTKGEVFDGAI